MSTELRLENQKTILADFIGAMLISGEPNLEIYKDAQGFYGASEDSNEAVPLTTEMLIDHAVEYMQHQPLENEELFQVIATVCKEDQAKNNKDFPQMGISSNPPSHAHIGFATINDYGYCPKNIIRPIYQCFSFIAIGVAPFGNVYLLDGGQSILVTEYNSDNGWNAVSALLYLNSPHSSQNLLNSFVHSDQLKIALAELNVDLPFDLTPAQE